MQRTINIHGNRQFTYPITQAGGSGRRPPTYPMAVALPQPGDDAPDEVKRLDAAGWVRVLHPLHAGVVDQKQDESYVCWEYR